MICPSPIAIPPPTPTSAIDARSCAGLFSEKQLKLVLKNSIQEGFRHVDCAQLYSAIPETLIGEALSEAMEEYLVQREEIFVTSQLRNLPVFKCFNPTIKSSKTSATSTTTTSSKNNNREKNTLMEQRDKEENDQDLEEESEWFCQGPKISKLVRRRCLNTLRNMKLDYLDLYLVGYECRSEEDFRYVWKAMEELVEEGLVKTIGIANVDMLDIMDVLSYCKIKPVIVGCEHQNLVSPMPSTPLHKHRKPLF